VSIIISCCTTGFAAATIWYDYDTSPEKRRMDPKIAGATPDTSRSPFFILLVMSGAFQVMAKSFSSALFFIASPIYFLAYMAGDHVLYQLYLVVRGDLRSFRPGFSVSLSVVVNTVEKAIADFTSCWLMRNPLTMHSAYFLFNQLTTHASAFVSVRVYVSAGGDHLDERVLWIGAGLLFAAWALTYVVRVREANSPLLTLSFSLTGTSSSRAWSSPSTATDSTPRRPACSTCARASQALNPTRGR
jgi:hypothetical protein